MRDAAIGDTVRVHYTGTLKDGSEFDSSRGREPLQFVIGTGQVIPGFDRGVVGMRPGQTRRVEIPVTDAYGPRIEELVMTVQRDRLPSDLEPTVGDVLLARSPTGDEATLTVTEVAEATVRLDGNHPLAGEDLVFEIEMLEIVEATG